MGIGICKIESPRPTVRRVSPTEGIRIASIHVYVQVVFYIDDDNNLHQMGKIISTKAPQKTWFLFPRTEYVLRYQ